MFVNHRHDDRPVSRPRGLPHGPQVRCDSAITGHVDHSTANQGMHCSGWDRSEDTRSARILRDVGKPGISTRLRVSVLGHAPVAFSLADVLLNPYSRQGAADPDRSLSAVLQAAGDEGEGVDAATFRTTPRPSALPGHRSRARAAFVGTRLWSVASRL